MNDLLIPYGISIDTGEILEPEDALSGRKCGCICPGCKMPLQARHSLDDDRRSHFAHDSKHTDADQEAIEYCPFNPGLAVREMARHIVKSLIGKILEIPEYINTQTYDCCEVRREVRITGSSNLLITGAVTEAFADGIEFDLALSFGEARLFVWFSYPGRPEPDVHLKGSAGAIGIDAELIKLSAQGRFSDKVRALLLSREAKFWLYHPRQSKLLQEDIESHTCPTGLGRHMPKGLHKKLTSGKKWDIYDPSNPQHTESTRYRCLLCKKSWYANPKLKVQCPDGCNSKFAKPMP